LQGNDSTNGAVVGGKAKSERQENLASWLCAVSAHDPLSNTMTVLLL
jgi:hypothetical protein